ncbi:DNA-binding response regulator LuxR family [Patulibacter medicamentivorans]|uniref:DNA-binding response regulator LuxR family n=1 Tax=Patulibacter medicamentivorans TaxID=1097667 RepID=H0EAL3_9ACTN|nr:response regulator transcription factor [Patulibacter medicamentivorans]EHN09340.1 DNA-binding response regulator LuxR family [Patulibacter medicamentivorans]
MAIRVLLVDDQALLRSGFRMILEAAGGIEVVGEADDGATGAEAARLKRPDVVLMDIRMGDVDGIEATRRIVAADAGKVVVLTTFDLDEYVYAALRAGASGFLLKDTRPADLVEAVRVVAGGDALLAPRITKRLLERFGTDLAAAPTQDAAVAELTDREREVLRLIAGGHSNLEIAELLVLTEATVKTHVSNVLRKLGVRDRVQAVVWAYEHGVVRPGEQGER